MPAAGPGRGGKNLRALWRGPRHMGPAYTKYT